MVYDNLPPPMINKNSLWQFIKPIILFGNVKTSLVHLSPCTFEFGIDGELLTGPICHCMNELKNKRVWYKQAMVQIRCADFK